MTLSRKILLSVLLSFGAFGIIEAVYYEYENATMLAHMIIIVLGLLLWCHAHAEEHDVRIPAGTRPLIVLMSIIGVSRYLFGAFGWKDGGRKLFWGVVWLVVASIFYMAAFSVTVRLYDGYWPTW